MTIDILNLRQIADYIISTEGQSFTIYLSGMLNEKEMLEYEQAEAHDQEIDWLEKEKLTDHIFYNALVLKRELAHMKHELNEEF